VRVLIVENNPDLAGPWRQHLMRAGLVVTWEQNRLAALKTIRFSKPEVIVVNLALPGSGALLIADFAAYHLPQTKLVFVTRSGLFSDGSIFNLAANACACVPETIAPADLAAMVEHYGTGVPA